MESGFGSHSAIACPDRFRRGLFPLGCFEENRCTRPDRHLQGYAAAYLVPQRASATIPESTYMAFIYADGSYRLVKTKGMEYGKVP